MNIIRNIIKGPVTSVTGLLIICITTYACTFQDMDWVWNGLAGCGFGCFLLFTPDNIKQQVIENIIKKKTDK